MSVQTACFSSFFDTTFWRQIEEGVLLLLCFSLSFQVYVLTWLIILTGSHPLYLTVG
ncbi:hypothetical protein BDZ89DRAFT_640740 [Hymenopellis radicata]|nr:hypothetical protein BDZ89DRAFT_640740 [Hymenopellis radicata]